MVTLYTIDCFNCKRLEAKLNSIGIEYTICKDKDLMVKRGMTHLPVLVVDGQELGFKEAMKWINKRKETL